MITPTAEELAEAVKSCTWTISVSFETERDPHGVSCSTIISVMGSFEFRDCEYEFRSSNPDYELEIIDFYDESSDVVESVRSHIESTIHDELEKECESKAEDAVDEAAEDAYLRKVGVHAYHGVSKSDF